MLEFYITDRCPGILLYAGRMLAFIGPHVIYEALRQQSAITVVLLQLQQSSDCVWCSNAVVDFLVSEYSVHLLNVPICLVFFNLFIEHCISWGMENTVLSATVHLGEGKVMVKWKNKAFFKNTF